MKIGFKKALNLGSGVNFPECFWAIGERVDTFNATAKTDLFGVKYKVVNLVPFASLDVFIADQPDNAPIPGVAPIVVNVPYYISELNEAGNIDLLFIRIQENSEFFSDAEIIDYTTIIPEIIDEINL